MRWLLAGTRSTSILAAAKHVRLASLDLFLLQRHRVAQHIQKAIVHNPQARVSTKDNNGCHTLLSISSVRICRN